MARAEVAQWASIFSYKVLEYKVGQNIQIKKTGRSLRPPALSKTKPQLMLFIEILEINNGEFVGDFAQFGLIY